MAAPGRAQKVFENPLGWRDPAGYALEKPWIGAAKPAQFGGPEGNAQHATGLRVDFFLIEFFTQLGGIRDAARVGPSENRSDRPAFSVESQQAVPESAPAHRHDRTFSQQTRMAPRL
jgi:hypothetical protein